MADVTLAPDLAAVREARHFVAAQCRAAGLPADVCDSAVLLTSEVVTNAFVHGRSEARLVVSTGPEVLRVEVGDDNSRYPQLQEQDDAALDGRGLSIVDLLATRWGVYDDPLGKVTWFELGVTAR